MHGGEFTQSINVITKAPSRENVACKLGKAGHNGPDQQAGGIEPKKAASNGSDLTVQAPGKLEGNTVSACVISMDENPVETACTNTNLTPKICEEAQNIAD